MVWCFVAKTRRVHIMWSEVEYIGVASETITSGQIHTLAWTSCPLRLYDRVFVERHTVAKLLVDKHCNESHSQRLRRPWMRILILFMSVHFADMNCLIHDNNVSLFCCNCIILDADLELLQKSRSWERRQTVYCRYLLLINMSPL